MTVWLDGVNEMCIQWRDALALRKVLRLTYGSHRYFIPLIVECVHLGVDLAFIGLKSFTEQWPCQMTWLLIILKIQ